MRFREAREARDSDDSVKAEMISLSSQWMVKIGGGDPSSIGIPLVCPICNPGEF